MELSRLRSLCPLKTPSALPNLHLRSLHYIMDRMLKIILRTMFSALRSRRALALALTCGAL